MTASVLPFAPASPEPRPAPLLRASGLRKAFGGRAVLDGVDLALGAGEIVVLSGRSGAGKTTLFRCLCGLTRPDAGLISLGEAPVGRPDGRIALVFQRFNLVGRASVLHNVLAGRLGTMPLWRVVTGRFDPAERARALSHLEQVGLPGFEDQRADTLSGGQQQRVAIARAAAQGARVILADEPVASLDPDNARAILALLARAARDSGVGVLVTLHQPGLAKGFGDRRLVLRDGRLAEDRP